MGLAPRVSSLQAVSARRVPWTPLQLRIGGRRRATAAGAVAMLGALTVVAASAMLAAAAAGEPSQYVPARVGGWPNWLSGPLRGLGGTLSADTFQTLTLLMCGGYVLVLIGARTAPAVAIALAIVAAQVALVLGPPLLSQDVFGYIGFARLGAVHGLDPYTHVPAQASADSVFPFIGWPFKHSPYGPLFTLASYATASLPVATAVWVFKAVAVAASLAATAVIAWVAGRLGQSRRWAAAFVGLNPVLLEDAVGGAHNDTLILLTLAAALALSVAARPRSRAAAVTLVAGIGIKVTGGLALPFMALAPRRVRERVRVAGSAALGLVLLAAIALVGFGTHALAFVGTATEQEERQQTATHSIPTELARLVGLNGTPNWWRIAFLGLFALVVLFALARTAKGTDWRVAAGWTTLALLCATAWLLPWYAIWALPLAAVCSDRRLRAATLVFCTYAVLIHLPLADPLLSPPRADLGIPAPAVPAQHRVELTGFQVLNHGVLDLRR
jgi:hypothetical protein